MTTKTTMGGVREHTCAKCGALSTFGPEAPVIECVICDRPARLELLTHTVRVGLLDARDALAGLPKSRDTATAATKLDEFEMWFERAVVRGFR